MKLLPHSPKKELKAFLKQKPLRNEMDMFKANLITLLDKISVIEKRTTDESEEHLKNDLRDFLRDTYYKDTNAINTKDNKDLVIHLGATTNSDVGVIIEAKRPTNINEMVSADQPNKKALHELILYYLDERNKVGNNQLKRLVATNVNEWYIIDANHFDKHIYRNGQIKKLYDIKINDKKDNPFFYEEIAKIIDKTDVEIPCIYFDIREYNTVLRNDKKEDDRELSALLKILSPQHLLKIAPPDDSNSLNESFYKELLHIIGLEETTEGTKNIIQRKSENRNPASLIETAIEAIITEDPLHRLTDPTIYGKTKEERIFNVSLELCITWINRILFLKLLEGQLVTYQQGNKDFRFLNTETIQDFDELFKLFHKVLAVNLNDRTEAIKSKYCRVPYLNSSLFEISELEDQTIKINALDNAGQLELFSATILKEVIRKSDKLNTIDYLFKFLDAYDFASEGSEDIQEDNKTIINASVLGKVFEKINGYKEGSIFTPAFITMYMCRKSIRMAVVEKFREFCITHDLPDEKISSIDDVYNLTGNKLSRQKSNEIINSLKICDPAVGSGHFLVSALNEIIAIKSELGILMDENGKTLRDYEIEIINDELIITDENRNIFTYNKKSSESCRVQKTLFHEKQIIIENCLFGVDVNPNSVKICRLRLWIELLKNAYYRLDPLHLSDPPELETLPNIDVNIKCGNSLLRRFPLDADLSKALKSIKYDVKAYRGFVADYKNEKNRDVKKGLQKIIDAIKGDFRTEIYNNDPKAIALNKKGGELFNLLNQTKLFEEDAKQKIVRKEKQQKLEDDITNLSKEIEEVKTNALYKNAFEWRFEFPEVLNNNGDFEGFDLVIGNPPYFSISTDEKFKILADKYETYSQTGDVYSLFYELANNLQKINGIQALIMSNKWMRTNYGLNLRKYMLKKSNPLALIDFGQNLIFNHAVVHTNIIISQRNEYRNELSAIRFEDKKFFTFIHTFGDYIEKNKIESIQFDEGPWNIIDERINRLKQKIEAIAKPLKDWDVQLFRGILTGLNEAFIINKTTKDKLIESDKTSVKFIKPILRGRDTRKYYAEYKDFYIINIPKGYTIKKNSGIKTLMEPVPRYGNMEFDEAWYWFYHNHPAIANHLLPFKNKAKSREDQGDFWWELRACSYIDAFEKPKIIFSEIVSQPQFYYDEKGYYPEATVFFISGNHLKYLTALLNSKAVTFFFKSFYMGGELVGKIRYKKAFMEQIPVPVPTELQEKQMNELVDKIIAQKQQGGNSDGNEGKIDELVYKLYEITPEEQKIIEGNLS
ncbi:MAG: TaqI-like C-terminal specificity domain-containing protein [Bacteroidota bacterium]